MSNSITSTDLKEIGYTQGKALGIALETVEKATRMFNKKQILTAHS
jgi:hypothetical protein